FAVEFANQVPSGLNESLLPDVIFAAHRSHLYEAKHLGRVEQPQTALILCVAKAKLYPSFERASSVDNRRVFSSGAPLVGPAAMDEPQLDQAFLDAPIVHIRPHQQAMLIPSRRAASVVPVTVLDTDNLPFRMQMLPLGDVRILLLTLNLPSLLPNTSMAKV